MTSDRHRTIRAALVDAGVPIDQADATAQTLAAQTEPAQLGRTDLAGMKPEEIVAAEKAGRLDALLGRKAEQ